jgi:5'-methylthioadenosine nucleosidase
MRITLLMAMREEASLLIERLGLRPEPAPWNARLPTRLWSGSRGANAITLVLPGACAAHGVDNIGSQAATLATHLACEHLAPDLLVNAGTAGGFRRRGGEIGKVYLAQGTARFHDRRIPVPGLREYGLGDYPLQALADVAARLGVETGPVSSGDSLDAPDADLALMESHGAVAKDMEAAAIAWVASLHGRPLWILKAITDLVDSGVPPEVEFTANLGRARDSLTRKVIELLDAMPTFRWPRPAS